MPGFQPVDCAGLVLVHDKIVSNELVMAFSLHELSLQTKRL
jgi:hypothetical protein